MENEQVANAETEIEWEILQAKPGQELALNEAPLGAGAEAVIRRYEFYHYNTAWGRTHSYTDPDTGLPVPYADPENGEVVECVVDGCNAPTPDELGDYIGRQIAGFNIAPPGSECSNGVDDDGDGGMDYDPATFADPSAGAGDPGCPSPRAATESPRCQDGVNNDADGLVDFDGGQSIHGACLGGVCPPGVSDPEGDGVANPDPECTSRPWRNNEKPGACGLGFEIALLLPLLRRLRRNRRRSS